MTFLTTRMIAVELCIRKTLNKLILHTMSLTGRDAGSSQGLPSYYDDFWRVLGVAREHIDHGQIDSGDFLEYEPRSIGSR